MWTLIVTLYIISAGEFIEVRHIDGFENQKACIRAMNMVEKTLPKNTRLKGGLTCVYKGLQ